MSRTQQTNLHVFKAADGWRWLGVSSNAYEDNEREIVSQKALEADAEQMSATGAFGPLRWWHVGDVDYANALDWTSAKAGAGIDIGTCDFSAVIGRMSVEGGTLHPAFGEAMAKQAGEFQMSRGFTHPMNEPDADGAYHHIHTFERSLLPKGKAANPFTAIQSFKESDMTLQEKIKSLADKFFAGDVSKAESVISEVQATDKELAARGVAFKEAPQDVTKAATDAPTGSAMDAGETGDDANKPPTVGDMTLDELVTALAPAIAQRIAGATKSIGDALDATKKELAEFKTLKTKEASDAAANITALNARVKELEGDAPTAKGYRATQDSATVKERAPMTQPTEDEFAKLANWMLAPKQ